MYLSRNNHSALHVICGSVTDVAIENQVFIVRTNDSYVHGHLTESQNLQVLKRALVWQDLPMEIEIKLVQKPKTNAEKDIKKLKTVFGEHLKIIGD